MLINTKEENSMRWNKLYLDQNGLTEKVFAYHKIQLDEQKTFFENETIPVSQSKCIQQCVKIINEARNTHKKILVCGDYDADGICATTILCMLLKKLNMNYGFYIPDRFKEGYGLNQDTIQLGLEKGYDIFITVDNGVKSFEAMRYAKENHATLVITDHHSYDDQDIDCDCFVHPRVMEETFEYLSGAGVALQIAMQFGATNEMVALTAIALIADCMELRKANRMIVKEGLRLLNQGVCPPIHALKNKAEDKLDETVIAYQIAPKLNGTGRMADIAKANNTVRYLMCEDLNIIMNGAVQINNINDIRKKKTAEMEKIAKEKGDNDAFMVVSDPDFHEGIVGIVASRICSEKKNCVAVLCEKENEYKGSIRSYQLDLMDFFKNATCFEKIGGHANAAGVTILKNQYKNFLDYIAANMKTVEQIEESTDVLMINESECTLQEVNRYEALAPFGKGFERVLFEVENIQINQIIPLAKGKHFKIISQNQMEYLFFNQSHLLEEIARKTKLSCIGDLQVNHFNGISKVNMIVKDIETV